MITSEFLIIGFSRREIEDEQFREFFNEQSKEKEWKYFSQHIKYQKGDFSEKQGYLELIDKLNDFDKQMGACITRFFYLATPPNLYLELITNILNKLNISNKSNNCIFQKNSITYNYIINIQFYNVLDIFANACFKSPSVAVDSNLIGVLLALSPFPDKIVIFMLIGVIDLL